MPHNARVLDLADDAGIIDELRKIETVDAGVRQTLSSARHYLVKLEHISLPSALILKEAFLSSGGLAVLRQNTVMGAVRFTDMMLSGTRRQYQRAFQILSEQGHGCPDIAHEVEAAIRHFDSAPAAPRHSEISDPRLGAMFGAIGQRTLVMGILNLTPDSFSDGGRFADISSAVTYAVEMVQNGADVIDIGGESTKPGAHPVSADEEMERVLPVIKELSGRIDVPISIDTTKAPVVEAALDAGALIVNDISAGLFDQEMPALVAKRQCPAILMHMKGTPQDMQVNPTYEDLMGEVCSFLRDRLNVFTAAGAEEKTIIIDPGFGFGKSARHNLELLRRLRELKSIGRPILVGASRKSTIGKVLGDLAPEERMEGTAATVAISIANGADIVRVHDVKEMARVARMTDAIVRGLP